MFTVTIYQYDNAKSQTYHFNKLKEAVEFAKNMRKIIKNSYFCINFYT